MDQNRNQAKLNVELSLGYASNEQVKMKRDETITNYKHVFDDVSKFHVNLISPVMRGGTPCTQQHP